MIYNVLFLYLYQEAKKDLLGTENQFLVLVIQYKQMILLYIMEDKPKVFFNNKKEWEDAKNTLFTEIKNIINKYVVLDEFEYEHMSYQGLTSRQYIFISGSIEQGLTILTNDKEWSKKIAWDEIMYGINGFFNGLINSNNWKNIYNLLSAQDLANIIYKNIEWQLGCYGDGGHYPCILEDIAQFKCIRCEEIDDYIDDKGLCINCEEI